MQGKKSPRTPIHKSNQRMSTELQTVSCSDSNNAQPAASSAETVHVGTVVSHDQATTGFGHNNANDDESHNPPTRRHMVYLALSIVAFALCIAGVFEPMVLQSADAKFKLTPWRYCTATPPCIDPAKDAAAFCSDARNLIQVIRAFAIMTCALSLIGAAIAASSFLGAGECAARNFKGIAAGFSIACTVTAALTFALVAGYFTKDVCPKPGSQPMSEQTNADGSSKFQLGAMLPLFVVGFVLELVAIFILFISSEWLDMFQECQEWCEESRPSRHVTS